jgi:hypothetical protein
MVEGRAGGSAETAITLAGQERTQCPNVKRQLVHRGAYPPLW